VIEELNGTQLFIAGTMLSKLAEVMVNNDISEADEDTKVAYRYVCMELDNLNKKIASRVLEQTLEGIKQMAEIMKENK